MTAFVYGVGTTSFGKQPEQRPTTLGLTAIDEALSDAQLEPSEIDAVFAGTVFGEPGVTQRILSGAGIVGVPVITIENACASGTSAIHEAKAAVTSERFKNVLALGVETMTSVFHTAIEPFTTDPDGRQGFGMPTIYGMSASRYMYDYGLTNEQMALVSVKNHEHGVLNERAQHRRKVTLEEVLESRLIADPITLLQCCSIADAAAAAVIGNDRGNPRDVRIRASALRSGTHWDSTTKKVWGWDIVHDTAQEAYEAAGIGPEDADLFEVHDAFTIGEIVTTEALGLCAIGGGGELVESRHTWLGGPQPVNPSGGLLSRGHPLGATGVAQLAEVVWQLRGEATGGRQVEGASVGVVETMGGGSAGVDGNACVVIVLSN
ncbi:MAG: thiolase family protein [Microthrixaceae bacterium]